MNLQNVKNRGFSRRKYRVAANGPLTLTQQKMTVQVTVQIDPDLSETCGKPLLTRPGKKTGNFFLLDFTHIPTFHCFALYMRRDMRIIRVVRSRLFLRNTSVPFELIKR